MTEPRYRLIGLHGFLGAASDWDTFRPMCPEARWDAVDLWGVFSDGRVTDWTAIGKALSTSLRATIGDDPLPVFLVGYSMGARLALSIPGIGSADSPVAGTCLVSCHPGLPAEDDGARAARKAADETWAQMVIDAPVAQLWKAWDAQPVFAGSADPRREARLPGPRVAIARSMRIASLGTQPDRRPLLRAWQAPLLWMTGERDAKFRAIAASLSGEVLARFVTLEHAGHRAPWDNPAAFSAALTGWVETVLAEK